MVNTKVYGKGSKGKATWLHSLVVRSRGACQRCGSTDSLQAAHIVGRAYSWTRTREDNAWCLCGACHAETGAFATEFMKLIDTTIGLEHYEELVRTARDGVRKKFDWPAEAARLQAVYNEIKALA